MKLCWILQRKFSGKKEDTVVFYSVSPEQLERRYMVGKIKVSGEKKRIIWLLLFSSVFNVFFLQNKPHI